MCLPASCQLIDVHHSSSNSQLHTTAANALCWYRAVHTDLFESAAMLTTFILLGKWLEARAKRHTCSVLTQLMEMAPDTACIVTLAEGGTVVAEQTVDARLVEQGDVLRVLPGQKVPADGEIIEVRPAAHLQPLLPQPSLT